MNKQAVFAGLDKITGRIISFDAEMGETVQFGALRIKPQACYTRPSTASGEEADSAAGAGAQSAATNVV